MSKIIIFERNDSFTHPGGDTVQITAIENYLIEQGHAVLRTSNYLTDLSPFDFVMIFNLTRPYEAYIQAKAATHYQKPYLLFPVYWDLDHLQIPPFTWKEKIKSIIPSSLVHTLRSINFYSQNRQLVQYSEIYSLHKVIRFVLDNTYHIMPNSRAELLHLSQKYPYIHYEKKSTVVYNGIDPGSIENSISSLITIDRSIILPDKFICCVGGIGPRKNQLNLVKAANQTGIQVVIVGRPSAGCLEYANQVKRIAKDNITFFDHLEQNHIFQIMKNSHGHIQPSYIETPGLASLEAAVIGCPIAVSNVAPVIEYFQSNALYCEPSNINSIATAMQLMISGNTPSNESTRDHIRNKYNWNNSLKPLLNIINTV